MRSVGTVLRHDSLYKPEDGWDCVSIVTPEGRGNALGVTEEAAVEAVIVMPLEVGAALLVDSRTNCGV